METRKKSIYKTITWRIIATLGTVIIALIFTGRLSISLGIGVADGALKTILYYMHERAWANHD
jgi:uncharacterized membrane protein